MANWKCSKCNVEMEETEEIKLIFAELDLPPGRGYKCPCCGVEYLDGDYVTEELGSVGDAAFLLSDEKGFDVTAFDHEPALIREAVNLHGTSARLHFDVEDAASLSYPDASFEGPFCEAAFSPMTNKREALAQYRRVLKPGSLVLMNDFVIRRETEDTVRKEVVHIPCFAGVQTKECYEELFRQAGFEPAGFYEEYGELLGVTAWLCRVYGVTPGEIGGYLSRYFHIGSPGATCDTAKAGEKKGVFFNRADLSYCQMIFRRL